MNRRKILNWLLASPLAMWAGVTVTKAMPTSSNPQYPKEYLALSDLINDHPIYRKYQVALCDAVRAMNNPEEIKKIRQELENYWGHEAVLDEKFEKNQQASYDNLRK